MKCWPVGSNGMWWGCETFCSVGCGPGVPTRVTRSLIGPSEPSGLTGSAATLPALYPATTAYGASGEIEIATGFGLPHSCELRSVSLPLDGSLAKALTVVKPLPPWTAYRCCWLASSVNQDGLPTSPRRCT